MKRKPAPRNNSENNEHGNGNHSEISGDDNGIEKDKHGNTKVSTECSQGYSENSCTKEWHFSIEYHSTESFKYIGLNIVKKN